MSSAGFTATRGEFGCFAGVSTYADYSESQGKRREPHYGNERFDAGRVRREAMKSPAEVLRRGRGDKIIPCRMMNMR